VLETGEYMRVGSSTPRKTNVRIVAATNVNIPNAIKHGRFREDLYYRLSTININIPPLRKRQGDAVLLFKKFALDTAGRYNIPEPVRLTAEAEAVVNSYKWPGNIRQLRNITEQLSILSESRSITPEVLAKLGITPNSDTDTSIATITGNNNSSTQHDYEQEIKILAHAVFELRSEVQELKEKLQHSGSWHKDSTNTTMPVPISTPKSAATTHHTYHSLPNNLDITTAEEIVDDDTLNIGDMEKRNILLALQRNHYKRKLAAEELGISERTLYRKIKAYGIDE
jgi:DNA-binding NtrC family response regulator